MREPLHLGSVGCGLLAHDQGDERIRQVGPKGGERAMETGDHPVAVADDAGLPGVEPVEKRGQTDPAGNGVELGEGEAGLGQQQIGPQHGRHGAAVAGIAGVGDERGWLPAVEVLGDPGREQRLVAQEVATADGAQVEGLERLVEFEAGRADGGQFFGLLRRDGPGRRRQLPGLRLKQRLGVE